MGKAEARALAANYMSRIVDPVINPAICYVRICVETNRLELGHDPREIHATGRSEQHLPNTPDHELKGAC